MKVPKSRPDSLVRDGKSIRVFHDSWAKLSEIARIRQQKKAECFDLIVTEVLQQIWDRMREEGKEPADLDLPDKKQQP